MRVFSLIVALLCFISSSAFAHKNSNSYLNIKSENNRFYVQWDIALQDLNRLLNLDVNRDGNLTWGEVQQRHNEIGAAALSNLQIKSNGSECSYGAVDHLINRHNGSAYAVIKTEIACPSSVQKFAVNYNFLFDQNAQHRGILAMNAGGKDEAFIFSPDNRSYEYSSAGGASSGFSAFFVKGVEHLLGGVDHLLFLFVLLLPATFGTLRGSEGKLSKTLIETAKILTAFTVAHAITLTLSVLKLVSFPVTPVEIIIAVSVAIAAADNIWKFIGKYRWAIAGGFGLIHGLGFANALGPLNLSPEALFTALLAFNLGLEAAQLLVAVILIPSGFSLFQQRRGAAIAGAQYGSAMAITIALLWTVDRGFGLEMMPF